MAFSMRTLLTADMSLPEAVRASIANGDPDSASHLVALGVSECEAAELLDEPCAKSRRQLG